MDAHQQLVHQLGGSAGAGGAHIPNDRAHRVKDRLRPPAGFRRAAHHNSEGAVRRPLRAAADGGVQKHCPPRGGGGGAGPGGGHAHGAVVNDNLAGAGVGQRFLQQHPFAGCHIGQAGQHNIAAGHHRGGGCGGGSAGVGNLPHLALAAVVDGQGVAGPQQVVGHRQPHPAQADKADSVNQSVNSSNQRGGFAGAGAPPKHSAAQGAGQRGGASSWCRPAKEGGRIWQCASTIIPASITYSRQTAAPGGLRAAARRCPWRRRF